MKAIRGKMESEARHVRAYRFFRIFKVRSVSKRIQAYSKGKDTQFQGRNDGDAGSITKTPIYEKVV